MHRFYWWIAVTAASCAPLDAQDSLRKNLPFPHEVVYLSSDRSHIAVFSEQRTRFGPPDLTTDPEWPSSPASYFQTSKNIWCLSAGRQNTDEYAVKRPIKFNDEYRCLRTKFRVIKCFDECRAAVIEIVRPLGGGRAGTSSSSMYIDDCQGVMILGVVSDLSKGIPLNAEWLRGEVGILAHPDYPRCM